MSPILHSLAAAASILLWEGQGPAERAAPASTANPQAGPGIGEVLTAEGGVVRGRIRGDRANGFRFEPEAGGQPWPLTPRMRLRFHPRGADGRTTPPPFRVLLGSSDRISGSLADLDETSIRLEQGPGGRPVLVARSGASGLVQRPGEIILLDERFESLDPARWKSSGRPASIAADAAREGEKNLRLPLGGAELALKLDEPLGSGRFDLAYHDPGVVQPGDRVRVELSFRGANEPASLQVLLGRDNPSLGLRTSGSAPAMAIQRLERAEGWHRLSVAFGPDRTSVAIDGDELAYGDGPGGPLVEVRLATTETKKPPEGDASAHFDDLRLVRFSLAGGEPETDPTQDEVRLTDGDQIFGRVLKATPDVVTVQVADSQIPIPWDRASGISFRRAAVQAAPLEGLWVRVAWLAEGSPDVRATDRIEGVLDSADDRSLTLRTPYAGDLVIPLHGLTEIAVVGEARRIVLDPTLHHLGSSVTPGLDPPQPEGGTLELAFELDERPDGPAYLVVDIVEATGVEGDPNYSDEVRNGELLTNAVLNGERFDHINRHITARNDTPTRVHLPIPEGLLRPGRNVLRFEQVGLKSEPETLDNLGLLGVAIEFRDTPPRPEPRP